MPRIINVKGVIIANSSKWLYDLFKMDSTCPNDITEVLKEVNGSESIVIEMNSPGGNVDAADEIYTAISTYKGDIEIHVLALAASAASEILMACKSYISPVGKIMIHNASTYASGDYRNMDSASNMLKKYNESIRNAYMAKTSVTGKKITDEELADLMDKTTYITAQEAVDKGFVDGLLKTNNDDKVPTVYNADPSAIYAPILDEDKIMELSKMLMNNQDNNQVQNMNADIIYKEKLTKGVKTMTLEEVRNQYPEVGKEVEDLVKNAKDEAQTEERKRLKEIDEISDNISSDLVADAKYENPVSAKDLAFNAIKQNKNIGDAYFKKAISDSQESGAGDVPSTPVDESGDETEDEKLAMIAANAANKKRGKVE